MINAQYLKTMEEKNYMDNISYVNIVGIMMHPMFCTCLDIAYVMNVVSMLGELSCKLITEFFYI